MSNKNDIKDAQESRMKRVVYNKFGGPEVLEVEQIGIPNVTKNQMLIQNVATSINGGDLNVRKGFNNKLVNFLSRFPKTTGQDVVGKIVKVGKGVTKFKVGDMVWGNTTTDTNSMAEYVAIDAKKISIAPSNISPIEAASIPCAGLTALVSIIDKGALKKGERVLIRGVGGVGLFAVQIAKSVGAHITVLGSKSTIEPLKKYGVDEVLDYHEISIKDLRYFDLIFDTVGTEHKLLRQKLTNNGQLLTISFQVSELIKLILSIRYGKHRSKLVIAFPNNENLMRLSQMVTNGQIVPEIDSIYSIDQIVEAHRRAEQRGLFGKIIVKIQSKK